jgi:hypothetical protein
MHGWIVNTEMHVLTQGLERWGDVYLEESESRELTSTEYEEHINEFWMLPKPPEVKIQDVMLNLAEMLADFGWYGGLRSSEETSMVKTLVSKYRQGEAATVWAIHEHLKAHRVVVWAKTTTTSLAKVILGDESDGQVPERFLFIEPEEALWDWWRSEGSRVPSCADEPVTKKDSGTSLDDACREALRHYGKPDDAVTRLSAPQKFQLVCVYWSDAQHLTPAKIRDKYRESISEGDYCLPSNKRSGRERVKTYIARGRNLLKKL